MYLISLNYDELHLINKTQFVKEDFGVKEEFRWELVGNTLCSLHYRVSSSAPCCGFVSLSQWAAPPSGQT